MSVVLRHGMVENHINLFNVYEKKPLHYYKAPICIVCDKDVLNRTLHTNYTKY